MEGPKRGEIWRARVREREGSEQRGGQSGERFYVVVSSDEYNEWRPRLTIAPLTSYTPSREEVRSLWGVTIQQSDYKDSRDKIISESDIVIDPIITDPMDPKYVPQEERLREEITHPDGTRRPFKSIIDCGQLWTVFSVDPSRPSLIPERFHDIRWHRGRCGILKDKASICVDAGLQVLVGGGVRYNGKLRFCEGNVFLVEFPGMWGKRNKQRCLVVSSPAVDAIRSLISTSRWGYYRQCTVVPLEEITPQDSENDPGIAFVNVHTMGGAIAPKKELAMCQEIYTIDWHWRNASGPVGHVPAEDMARVREELRDYLGLPE